MVRGIRLLAVAALLVALGSLAGIAAGPAEGKWKLVVTDRTVQIDLVALSIADKEGKPAIKIEGFNSDADVFEDAEVVDVAQGKETLSFTLKTKGPEFKIIARVPAGEAEPKILRGVILIGDRGVEPIHLERTKDKELDKRTVEGARALAELTKAEPAEQDKLFKELEEKYPGSPLLLTAAQSILAGRIRSDAKVAEVEAAAALVSKQAALWGQPLVAARKLEFAQMLLRAEKLPELALKLAFELKNETPAAAPPERILQTTQILADALRANKKEAEADKLEPILDQLYERSNISFKVEPFQRKGKGTRVAVVELFTGSQCPPCVSADIAFDASLKAFQPSEAVFLEYHLHIPGPDPMTNTASEGRQRFYGGAIRGTPTAFVNGQTTRPLGGGKSAGEARYQTLREAIAGGVEGEDAPKLKLTVQRDGDKLVIEAAASEVAKPDEALKLRVALVEDVVKYVGGNGQRLHHHVVRDFPGGVDGLVVKDKAATQKVVVSVAEVREKLGKYLDDFRGGDVFGKDKRPLDLKHLKVVAFLQNDDTKEILQAAQADVPEAK